MVKSNVLTLVKIHYKEKDFIDQTTAHPFGLEEDSDAKKDFKEKVGAFKAVATSTTKEDTDCYFENDFVTVSMEDIFLSDALIKTLKGLINE